MAEFNSDGSIKLPSNIARLKEEQKNKLTNQRCIQIEKDVVSTYAPKICKLRITLSDAITDSRFIQTIYTEFNRGAATPSKLIEINEKEFEVQVGTDFRRCTDCTKLITQYREFLYGNLIEKKGTCTFETIKKEFCFEDYFD